MMREANRCRWAANGGRAPSAVSAAVEWHGRRAAWRHVLPCRTAVCMSV